MSGLLAGAANLTDGSQLLAAQADYASASNQRTDDRSTANATTDAGISGSNTVASNPPKGA